MNNVTHSGSFIRVARAGMAAVLLSAAALTANPAGASPEYPGALSEAAGMSCVPQCTVCHTTNPGRATTALQPFSIAMRGKGLLAGSPGLVAVAFEKLRSDPDTKPEDVARYAAMVAALEDDYDPNTGQLACGPTYGCGARVAKAPPKRFDALTWALGALGLVVAVRRAKSKH
jgi:hypothetical protein